MKYYCCDERRLEVVRQHGLLNGLEYLEVHDSGLPGDPLRQRTLFLKFLLPPPAFTSDQIVIDGGERIESVDVEWVAPAGALPPGEAPTLVDGLSPLTHFLVVRCAYYGDFSEYRLRVVSGPGSDLPPAGFDPRLSELRFSFKVLCESDFDCATETPCPTPPGSSPRLDYLAKDYESFRRLMLDRLSTRLPDWDSSNAADVGVTLVELLAYAGDQLSYQQDAVATEAYLGTARRRTSLRRHARLMDYQVHEGCNGRTWVQAEVNDDGVLLPRGTPMFTRIANMPGRIAPGSDTFNEAMASGAEVFEATEDKLLYTSHARMPFYSWGERECCLPKGAISVTLDGHYPNLKAGDVLVFVEEIGPRTGLAEDADRSHRHAVRLTHVALAEDPSGGLFLTPPTTDPTPVTEIMWEAADALPFPLCLSTLTDLAHGQTYLPQVSGAFGNILLADHGRTISAESLGEVPEPLVHVASPADSLSCRRQEPIALPPRYRPQLLEQHITHTVPLDDRELFIVDADPVIIADLQNRMFSAALQQMLQTGSVLFTQSPVSVQGSDGHWSVSDGRTAVMIRLDDGRLHIQAPVTSASAATAAAPGRATPAVTATATYQSQVKDWHPRADLLSSGANAREFVVEAEHDGRAFLRFGDDVHGMRPNSGTAFTATYRIGNGPKGNIGAESLSHIVSNDARLVGVSNPLPAQGGVAPETAEDIRRDAPEAFRTQERAVTPNDYSEVTQRHASVQQAAATFRWTGSWHTVFLTVDRKGGGPVDAAYENTMRDHVERYRMAGYDLEVDAPHYVALELGMTICVEPDYFRADVRAALMTIFSKGWLPDGRRALFHPDNFTFGQPVYLSELYAAAQAVEGVASVVIDRFQRLRAPDPKPLEDGVLTFSRLEIARLDNDANYPERGVLRLEVGGGK